MKIYFIDKDGKNLRLKKKLEELKIENIEHKKDISHRIYKTDYVITLDFNNEYKEYSKINNLIIITSQKEKNVIWNMANNLNTKDIILNNNDDTYIAKRIAKIING